MSLTQTMDCVVIDRISYERMKLESDQFQARTQELERENELLRNELALMKKLNDALENIKFNLDKLVQAVREQFRLAETPFDREITMWQSEYTNIKCMLTQLGLLNTAEQMTNMCTNSTETTTELVFTTDQIWTTSTVANSGVTADNTIDNDSYLCAEEDIDNSLVKSDADLSNNNNNNISVDNKTTKTKQQSKKVKGLFQSEN